MTEFGDVNSSVKLAVILLQQKMVKLPVNLLQQKTVKLAVNLLQQKMVKLAVNLMQQKMVKLAVNLLQQKNGQVSSKFAAVKMINFLLQIFQVNSKNEKLFVADFSDFYLAVSASVNMMQTTENRIHLSHP